MRLRKEMQSTSAQDNFSKWAKLRRQYDKANAQYEQSGRALAKHTQTHHCSLIHG